MSGHVRRDAGFTLLEILVVLVVLGLLLGGLAQGLRFGIGAWDRQGRSIERTAALDAVDRTLRGMIEQIDPGNAHDAPAILGTAASLEFTSDLPAGAAALPTRRAEMRLLVDRQHRLILRWAPYTHAERVGPPATPTDTVLAERVQSIELAYLGRGAAALSGWHADWGGQDLPGLIRIRLVFEAGSGMQWPDIVAAPQLTAL